MNKTRVLGSIGGALLCASSVIGVWRYNAPSQAPGTIATVATLNIKGQNVVHAKVGQLVVIDAGDSDAKSFLWQVTPTTPNFHVDKDNKTAVLTSPSAQTYQVTVAAAKADTADMKSVTVIFDVADVIADLDSKVLDWVNNIQSPTKKSDAIALGQSFQSIAIAAGNGTIPLQAIVDQTSASNHTALGNNATAWKSFFDALGLELKAEAAAGKLITVADHVKVWNQIGTSLKNYAATL